MERFALHLRGLVGHLPLLVALNHSHAHFDSLAARVRSEFFYITCTLAVLAFTQLSNPFWWFALNAVFSALVWGLFVYDLRMIRRREADSRSDDGSLLYRNVMRDQRLNIWFLIPAICLFNILCALAIHTHELFFLGRGGHLILIGLLILGLIVFISVTSSDLL